MRCQKTLAFLAIGKEALPTRSGLGDACFDTCLEGDRSGSCRAATTLPESAREEEGRSGCFGNSVAPLVRGATRRSATSTTPLSFQLVGLSNPVEGFQTGGAAAPPHLRRRIGEVAPLEM